MEVRIRSITIYKILEFLSFFEIYHTKLPQYAAERKKKKKKSYINMRNAVPHMPTTSRMVTAAAPNLSAAVTFFE